MKRVLCSLFLVASLMYAKDDGTIRVAGPVASISHPIFKMIDDDMLKNINKKIEFRLWQNPDELRAMILKKEIDFVALPTNVAANLYNKNQPIKLTSVPVWGILEIVSSDEAISSLEDLKNEEIIVPFRADMPDIILQVLIKKLGYDFKTDYKLRYVPTPPDAMQLLLLRRAKHVLLAEPVTSMIMRKTGSFPISVVSPTLFRKVDLEKEWGRAFNIKPRIPLAGLASLGEVEKEVIKEFNEAYERALLWCIENPKEAGELVSKGIPSLTKEAIMDAFTHVKFDFKTAKDSKNELNDFFEIILEHEPKLIGDKIPNDEFYSGEGN